MLKSPITSDDLPPLGGMNQLDSILDIVKNESTYRKRLADLKKKRDELIDLISTVGSVNAIHEIREQAKLEKIKITEELDALKDKKEKADEIINQAHSRARTIEADAASRAREQKAVLDQREKELLENRKQFGERERVLRLAEVKVSESQTAVDAELKRLDQLQKASIKSREDFEERRQKIEKFVAGV